jgi:hypothetical protein
VSTIEAMPRLYSACCVLDHNDGKQDAVVAFTSLSGAHLYVTKRAVVQPVRGQESKHPSSEDQLKALCVCLFERHVPLSFAKFKKLGFGCQTIRNVMATRSGWHVSEAALKKTGQYIFTQEQASQLFSKQ